MPAPFDVLMMTHWPGLPNGVEASRGAAWGGVGTHSCAGLEIGPGGWTGGGVTAGSGGGVTEGSCGGGAEGSGGGVAETAGEGGADGCGARRRDGFGLPSRVPRREKHRRKDHRARDDQTHERGDRLRSRPAVKHGLRLGVVEVLARLCC